MRKILIQKITQNNWNFWTVNLIIRAKKLLSSRQIFRYAVLARTVTKKALPISIMNIVQNTEYEMVTIVIYCNVYKYNCSVALVTSDDRDTCVVLFILYAVSVQQWLQQL